MFLETIDDLAETDWKDLPPPSSMLGCIVAGEGVKRRVEEQLEIWDIEPRWVVSSPHAARRRPTATTIPNRLGVDRWVALIGARHRVLARGRAAAGAGRDGRHGGHRRRARRDGRFLGGLILPGFGLMLRALEMGTAGLKAPTGEVVDFPTNTSDALMSGGADAIAGAVERMHRQLLARTGQEPVLLMSGGAAVKLAPITDLPFETVDTLIFEGLLALQSHRLAL